ncbi:hypothetical protein TARUN_9508 [Trichoderma arundinaceum]|uniref:Uncharacterized protein n=1 Tax=Trichoderma arundinaceum TaxID=490622 RepID=A0A395N9E7_TRIAR|nr:hypothetical protein TARUN_9508 [Trichoderma arundinaceum]
MHDNLCMRYDAMRVIWDCARFTSTAAAHFQCTGTWARSGPAGAAAASRSARVLSIGCWKRLPAGPGASQSAAADHRALKRGRDTAGGLVYGSVVLVACTGPQVLLLATRATDCSQWPHFTNRRMNEMNE